ncbi:MAG: hypothetical protein RMN52_17595 [Anaerolineae bacterium]|nr:hypothetical protein [Candidatus Roseilinea sp.]MDW8451813.1 hypothetical protein [Anaerolineae bacterium]
MTDQTLIKIRELLLNEFSEPELIALCKDIGLDYEALPGAGTFGKTREIVEAARAQDKLRLLQSRLRELKPEAYAASMGAAAAPAEAPADGAAPVKQEEKAGSPIPRVIVPLLALLALVIFASLIFSRLGGGAATQATPQAAAEAASTEQPAPAPTEAVPTAQPEVIAAEATPENTPSAPEAAPAAPTAATAADFAATAPVESPTAESLPAPPAPVATNTLSADEAHPAAMNVRQINDQLTLFYTGKASAQDLEYFWMDEALRTVVDFSNTRLLRAMRITADQRDALEITHEYLRAPAVTSETTNGAVVTSREFWRYANSLNRNEVCEVRDYVYDMVRDGERYRVRSVQSRLVRSGCSS